MSAIPQPDFIDLGFEYWDKIVHLAEYFVYGVLLIAAISGMKPGTSKASIVWIVILAGAVYGFSDELHQYFVPGRSADIFDWVADVAGTALSLVTVNTIGAFLTKFQTLKYDE